MHHVYPLHLRGPPFRVGLTFSLTCRIWHPVFFEPHLSHTSDTHFCTACYSGFDCVPNCRERAVAVWQRMILHKERQVAVPLFAWGRMTLTIKPLSGEISRPLELWKPKRHEIVAVLAYLWMCGGATHLGLHGHEVSWGFFLKRC